MGGLFSICINDEKDESLTKLKQPLLEEEVSKPEGVIREMIFCYREKVFVFPNSNCMSKLYVLGNSDECWIRASFARVTYAKIIFGLIF